MRCLVWCIVMLSLFTLSRSLEAFSLERVETVATDVVPRDIPQGGLFLVTVSSSGPIEVTGMVDDEEITFFQCLVVGTWRAIGGIGLDEPAGPRQLVIRGVDQFGASFEEAVSLRVVSGDFPEQRLRVAPSMAQPPDEVRERIRRESALLRHVFSQRTEANISGAFLRPVAGRVTSPFGAFRTFNGTVRGRHRGVDLRGARGTPIRSSNSGTVALVADLYFAGRTVVVDHGLGIYTMYAHLDEFHAKEGQSVSRGDILGFVGATGRVTGPHLHWEVRIDGRHHSPLDLLALPLVPSVVYEQEMTALSRMP